MDTLLNALPYITAAIGCWAILNGLLHDFFVLSQHKGGYDRTLLRLLMDGHILITCGIMQLIAWKLQLQNYVIGYYLVIAVCISLLVYCDMIFPFLKSIFTIALQVILLVLIAIRFFYK